VHFDVESWVLPRVQWLIQQSASQPFSLSRSKTPKNVGVSSSTPNIVRVSLEQKGFSYTSANAWVVKFLLAIAILF
jgi:hypothetical protein